MARLLLRYQILQFLLGPTNGLATETGLWLTTEDGNFLVTQS